MEQFDSLNLETEDSQKSFAPTTAFQLTFDKMVKDMRFVGIFVIIYGVITCLTIIGALIGVPLIFAGMRMRESADQFSYFRTTNNAAAMRSGFELQSRYFNIFKILIIAGLILTALYIIFIIVFLSSFLGMFFHSGSSFSS